MAKKAHIGLATIQRLERGSGPLMAHVSTAVKIESCLKDAGVSFIDAEGDRGEGVRLEKVRNNRETKQLPIMIGFWQTQIWRQSAVLPRLK